MLSMPRPSPRPGKPRGKKTIAAGELSDVFGIEMAGAEPAAEPTPAPEKKTSKPRPTATRSASQRTPKRAVAKPKKAPAVPVSELSKPRSAKKTGSKSAVRETAKPSSRKRAKLEVS